MTYKCNSLDYEKNIKFEEIVSEIQSVAKRFNIDNKYHWIFSEQNVLSSKTRVCANCQQKYNWGGMAGIRNAHN